MMLHMLGQSALNAPSPRKTPSPVVTRSTSRSSGVSLRYHMAAASARTNASNGTSFRSSVRRAPPPRSPRSPRSATTTDTPSVVSGSRNRHDESSRSLLSLVSQQSGSSQVSLATFGSGTSSAVDPPTVLRAAKQMIAAALDGEEPSAKALKLTTSEARVLKAHLGDVIAEIRGLAADDKKRKEIKASKVRGTMPYEHHKAIDDVKHAEAELAAAIRERYLVEKQFAALQAAAVAAATPDGVP